MKKLPKAVQDLAEEADRISAQLQGDPPSEPDPQEQQAPAAESTQAPVEPVVPPAAEQPKADDESWQKRYLTLQGMFNAEVPRLNTQVKELQSQLQQAIASLEAAKTAQTAQADTPAQKLVTEKDVEAFGGELIDLMRRQAAEVFASEKASMQAEIASLRSENVNLTKQLGGVAEKQGVNDRRAYFSELKKLVPDYEAVNVDAGFMSWLAEADPLSGVPRQAYLNNAWETFDVERTAKLFTAWKEMTGRVAQPQRQAQQELQRQVQPGASRTSVTPAANPADKVWSAREIEAYYTAVAKGQYSGRKEEAAKIEAEIDAAVASGRVAA